MKQMQGLLQDSGLINPRPVRKESSKIDKFRISPPPKVSSNTGPSHIKSKHKITRSHSQSSRHNVKQHSQQSRYASTNRQNSTLAPKLDLKSKPSKQKDVPEPKFTNRAMQTERTDDPIKLYETGVIKYPSPDVMTKRSPRKDKKKQFEHGEPAKKQFEHGEPASDILTEAVDRMGKFF